MHRRAGTLIWAVASLILLRAWGTAAQTEHGKALDEALARGWLVVDMKCDWG
jgi:hypothetical protein